MIGALSRTGAHDRREDDNDRRRRIVTIATAKRPAIEDWLGHGAGAWRAALEPLTPAQRALFVETLRAYERAVESPPAT
jgi:DNA-binding MarR family transcriptional regulator